MNIGINKTDIKKSSLDINLIICSLIFILGMSLLFIPVQYVLCGVLVLIFSVFMFIKPQYCLYLTLFTVPFSRFTYYIGGEPPGIAIDNGLAVLLFLSIACRQIFLAEKINISTKLDKWLILLGIYVLITGLHSYDFNKGIFFAFKYLEGIVIYYSVTYLVRAKKTDVLKVTKMFIYIAVLQVLFVIFPLTHKFAVMHTPDARGYLGIIGLGPLKVHQAKGSFGHFMYFPFFILPALFLLLSLKDYLFKNKYFTHICSSLITLGVFLSYSRGALSAMIIAYSYYLYHVSENKKVFLKKFALIVLLTIPFAYMLLKSRLFHNSLNPRDNIWIAHFNFLKENLDSIIFGFGWNSLTTMFRENLITVKAMSWPHNYYLFILEEAGIVGLILFMIFFVKSFLKSLKKINCNNFLQSRLNLAINVILLIFFYQGINDQIYYDPSMFITIMYIMSINYSFNEEGMTQIKNCNNLKNIT